MKCAILVLTACCALGYNPARASPARRAEEADPHAGHDHHEEETCGCASVEDGWKINCADTAPVLDAVGHLDSDGCATTCTEVDDCLKHYRILQAHHDHCAHGTLDEPTVVKFHALEAVCGDGCHIERQFDASLSACPTVTCAASTAAQQTQVDTLNEAANSCASTCSGDCTAAFKSVVAYHDTCEEEELLEALETALHTYEDACDDSMCNTKAATFEPNVCDDSKVEAPADKTDHTAHGHDDEETCGCAAKDDGWKINCDDIAPVNEAFEHFAEDKCAVDYTCTSDLHCQAEWRVIQAHHDHCPHGFFTETMTASFHSYETSCGEGCMIARQFDTTLPQCAAVTCTDSTAMRAAVEELKEDGCLADCTSAHCVSAFQEVVAFHDTCDHDDVIAIVETALHDYEEACEAAVCNTVSEAFNANVCVEHHEDDSKEDGHDDEQGELCGCAAKEAGWTIDCSDLAAVTEALTHLADDKCATDCHVEEKEDPHAGHGHRFARSGDDEHSDSDCLKNYLILQAHHDHCPHATLDTYVSNELFHSYEAKCGDGCAIERQYDADGVACPAVTCTAADAQTAAVTALKLEANTCMTTCAGVTVCEDAFKEIVAFHDTCEHDQVSELLETTLHEYEEICEAVVCNTHDKAFDPNAVKCEAHKDDLKAEGFDFETEVKKLLEAAGATDDAADELVRSLSAVLGELEDLVLPTGATEPDMSKMLENEFFKTALGNSAVTEAQFTTAAAAYDFHDNRTEKDDDAAAATTVSIIAVAAAAVAALF